MLFRWLHPQLSCLAKSLIFCRCCIAAFYCLNSQIDRTVSRYPLDIYTSANFDIACPAPPNPYLASNDLIAPPSHNSQIFWPPQGVNCIVYFDSVLVNSLSTLSCIFAQKRGPPRPCRGLQYSRANHWPSNLVPAQLHLDRFAGRPDYRHEYPSCPTSAPEKPPEPSLLGVRGSSSLAPLSSQSSR